LAALIVSKYRKDLLTPWPWLGGALCLVVVSPYLFWQVANHWPTLEYWTNYGTARVYQASIQQYLTNILIYISPFLIPLWTAGLYRIFRRLDGENYSFLGLLFLMTLVLLFVLHASVRMLAELFMPILAGGAVFLEEILDKVRWERGMKATASASLLVLGLFTVPLTLPILPVDTLPAFVEPFKPFYQPLREFNGGSTYFPPTLAMRIGWDKLVQEVAGVYVALPAEDRVTAGIYADSYMSAGAIDLLGPQYGLPHAVSGSLTYYLWGPGYSWNVMVIITHKSNNMAVFFDKCELKATVKDEFDGPIDHPNIFVCKNPKVSADAIWTSAKSYR
jgi:hypothetical protein